MGFRKGTGFTNLSKVVNANKGNKLGSAVGGGISTQNQQLAGGVQTAQQKFQEEAQKNRLDTDEAKNKREEILGRFAPASSGTSAVAAPATPAGSTSTVQPPAKPASPVSDQEINDFTKFRTGTYAGPKELEDVGSLYGKAQQTEQLGDLSRSSGGRQELLRRFVGTGQDYNQGQRRLDETLLGQDSAGVRTAARETKGATDRVSQANQQAGNLAQEYTGRAKQFGVDTTQRLGEVKAPLSTDLDARVTQNQQAETKRLANLKSIQEAFTGQGDYGSLDKMTNLGLGLQDAMNQGYLSQADATALLGDDGLIARGQSLGLDVNSLINERIKNSAAQNVGRTGVASDEDIAKLNALDRLSGKQGTDLEFLQGQGKYAAGKTGFDLASLGDYISKSEQERAVSDKATADKIAARQARYAQQAAGGLAQAGGGGMELAGAAINQGINPESYYNPSTAIGNVGGAVQGAGDLAIGQGQAFGQSQSAILEGLAKMNIGGKSLADTEGGRQLLKAAELNSKIFNEGGKQAGQAVNTVSDSIKGLGNASLAEQLTGAGLAKSLASGVKNQVSGQINNVGKAAGSAWKKAKKLFSDENLKTDIDYDPKDVQSFMDRLKPASYNYKDEVKNDPRASKDRQIGVMAQDLEKSKLGKEAVEEGDIGKIVDYKDLQPKMLASLAALNQRLKKIEGGGKDE